jgi:hypothetical protein
MKMQAIGDEMLNEDRDTDLKKEIFAFHKWNARALGKNA